MLNRSLLLIAYKFPPMQSISCNRTWAIYNGMKEYFDGVHVVSTSNRHILAQDDVDTSAVSITDAKTLDYRTIFQKKNGTTIITEKSKTSLLGKTAAKLQSSFPTMYLLGEGNLFYINNAVEAAQNIIEREHITHLFSSFPPYADHLIAYKLKQRYPHLFWIADFRDLHVDPAQDNLYWRKYQERTNTSILQKANILTTVSEGLATHLRKLHPNVQVLRNGIRETDVLNISLYPKFTIAYTGSMFQDKRRADTLMAALKELLEQRVMDASEVELIYAGKDSSVWHPLVNQYGLGTIFRDHGMVSKKEAESIQQRSHVNLLLTYSTEALKGNLTGKLYEYLSAHRPILVLINGPADKEIEEIIAQTHSGIVVYHNDITGTVEFLRQAYAQWRENRTLPQQYNEAGLSELKWKHILDEFASKNQLTTHVQHA